MDNKKEKKYLPTYEIWSKYRSALMGMAIISIMILHYVKDYREVFGNLTGWKLFYYRYIGAAGVDVFLFLSGLGLYYSFKRKQGKVNLKTFYFKKLSQILVPYLLIGIPAYVVRRMIWQGKDLMVLIKDLTFINFFTIGESWYWYIGMAAACYLVFPLLFRYVEYADNKWKEMIQFALLFGLITLGCHLMSVYQKDLYGNINAAVLRIFPFILGTFVGRRAYEKRPLTWVNAVWVLPWLYFWSYAKSSNVMVLRYMSACNALMVCFFVSLIFFILQNLKYHPLRSFLDFTGRYTLELYLTHVTFRVFMSHFGKRAGTIRREIFLIVLSVAVSALLHAVSQWILKNIHLPDFGDLLVMNWGENNDKVYVRRGDSADHKDSGKQD